jgi:hypothetical protein
MQDSPSPIHDAVSERDTSQLRSLLIGGEFVLLSTTRNEQDDDGNIGAITAEIGDIDVLVVFTSEQSAGHFVHESGDLFEEDEEVDGIVVEGDALLDYLPDGFGILLDPESDGALVIEPAIIAEVKEISS